MPEKPAPTIAISVSLNMQSPPLRRRKGSDPLRWCKLRWCKLHLCNLGCVSGVTSGRMSAAERREQLLDVTKQLVGEQGGFHGVSIEAIARRAGITRPVVYGHFKGLGELLEAMLDREGSRALGQLAEALPQQWASGGDPREGLLAGLRGYLETVRADPVTWRLVLMPPEGAPQALRDQVTQGREAII